MPALLCLPWPRALASESRTPTPHVLSLREGDPDYLQHYPSGRVILHSPECCARPLAPRSSACV